jgi:hypothetical protein
MLRTVAKVMVGLALAAALAGCGSPFWVDGLTLPDKSKPITQTTMPHPGPGMDNLAGYGQVDKVLSVSFNGPSWEGVTEHILGCLSKQGFTDQTAQMVPLLQGAGSHASGDDILKATRLYASNTSMYLVTLIDIKQLDTADGASGRPQFPGLDAVSGSYSMSVFKLK